MAADDKRGGGLYDIEPRRSIFAALWFRVILVLIVVGVIGALAVPYVLDVVSPPAAPKPATLAKPTPSAVATPAPPPAPAAAPVPALAPTPAEAPAPKPPAVAPAPMPAEPASQPAATEEKQAERPTTTKPAKQSARRVAKAQATPAAPARGAYWVQVGAFKDAESAKRLAARLRDQSYHVEESATASATRQNPGSTPAPPPGGGSGSDRYDVFVGGGTVEEITAKLSLKGLTSEPARDGVVVRPSLPLRDAVALSKDLAATGLKVQVRRAGSSASAASASAMNGDGAGLHRVRVGPYPDRAAAASALKELEAKGYKPFIARR